MKTKLPLNAYEKPTLIIISHIKNFIKEKGYRTNSLTPRAVNDAVIEIIEKAIRRTKLDKKKLFFLNIFKMKSKKSYTTQGEGATPSFVIPGGIN